MISSFRPMLRRLEGWLVLAGLALAIYLLLAPRVSEVLDQWARFRGAESLALSHAEKLARPVPPDKFAGYRSFVVPVGPDADPTVLTGSVQSALIELVRARKARLVDLRETGANESVNGLRSITWHLEIEGDVEAALDVIRALEDLPQPVLIDELDLKPAGRAGEPDRNMRLTMSLKLWTGDIN
tara:strand:+ start:204 stop:755 length:552 start_codon:yes stop_codon:yes gene_type:complete